MPISRISPRQPEMVSLDAPVGMDGYGLHREDLAVRDKT